MVREMCCGLLRRTAKCRTFFGVVVVTVMACLLGGSAVHNLRDPEFVTDHYCQNNNHQKTGEDAIDYASNICNSSIVLPYEPEDLGPALHATSYLQAIPGLVLVISGVVVVVGLCRQSDRNHGAWQIVTWIGANILWVVSLVIAVIVLFSYSFQYYACILLAVLVVSALSLLDFCIYRWKIPRQGSYDVKAVPNTNFGDETGIDGGDVTALAV